MYRYSGHSTGWTKELGCASECGSGRCRLSYPADHSRSVTPWTALLSRRRYPDHIRAHPLFAEANLVITGAWTVYFTAAAAATALAGSWMAIAFTVPTPLLGWLSYRVGDRY